MKPDTITNALRLTPHDNKGGSIFVGLNNIVVIKTDKNLYKGRVTDFNTNYIKIDMSEELHSSVMSFNWKDINDINVL